MVEPPPVETYNSSPTVTIILTVILLVFFFAGFFSIYFCRCFMDNVIYSWYSRSNPNGTLITAGGRSVAAIQGLDQTVIDSFPTFPYATVRDFRKESHSLECAICLSEFQDDSTLRLLPSCCHVFHQGCIDIWLGSHKTCPVCRRTLDPDEKPTTDKSPPTTTITTTATTDSTREEDHVSIEIRDVGGAASSSSAAAVAGEEDKGIEKGDELVGGLEKFSRSHSTGHSIVRARNTKPEGELDGGDKYTLRLPEHLKAKLYRGHQLTSSCTTFDEFNISRTEAGFAEVSESPGRGKNVRWRN